MVKNGEYLPGHPYGNHAKIKITDILMILTFVVGEELILRQRTHIVRVCADLNRFPNNIFFLVFDLKTGSRSRSKRVKNDGDISSHFF